MKTKYIHCTLEKFPEEFEKAKEEMNVAIVKEESDQAYLKWSKCEIHHNGNDHLISVPIDFIMPFIPLF